MNMDDVWVCIIKDWMIYAKDIDFFTKFSELSFQDVHFLGHAQFNIVMGYNLCKSIDSNNDHSYVIYTLEYIWKIAHVFKISCGTVALYGLFTNFFFLADHRATDFTLSKICGTPTNNTSHLSTVMFTTKRFVRAESCG